jgi:hypothetical protein
MIGVIEVVNRRGGAFSDDDLALLAALAGSVAIAIENAQLWENLKASADRLRAQVVALRRDLARCDRFGAMIGANPGMAEVFRLMEHAAASPIAVLIEGSERDRRWEPHFKGRYLLSVFVRAEKGPGDPHRPRSGVALRHPGDGLDASGGVDAGAQCAHGRKGPRRARRSRARPPAPRSRARAVPRSRHAGVDSTRRGRPG